MRDELEEMQRPRVEAWCKAQNEYHISKGKFGLRLTNPQKIGKRWYAKYSSGNTVIPYSAYKPPFPGSN